MSPTGRGPLVVVGASGYLGRRIVALAPRGETRLVGTHHSAPTAELRRVGDAAEWRRLDVRDRHAIDALVDETRPWAIINCAYVQSGAAVEAVTAVAPGVLAAAARRVGARFVHLSSDVVFPGRDDRPYREDDEPAPVHDYGRAKLRAERAVRAAHPTPLIVRTSLIHRGAGAAGAGAAPEGPQERMVRAALTGADTWFFTDEVRNPIAVDVLAAAVLELVAGDRHGIIHVAGADAVDRLTFAQLLAAAMGADPGVLRGRPRDEAAGPRPGNLALDCARARAILTTSLPGVRATLSRPSPRSDTDW